MRNFVAVLVLAFAACPPPVPYPPPPTCEVTGCTNGAFCDPVTLRCVFQAADGGSGCLQTCAATEQCVSNTCTPCRLDTLCTAGLEACRVGGGCTTCREGTCGADFPKCQPGWGCSECLADSDCPAARPFCGAPRCQECRTNTDCPGGACFSGGCRTSCNTTDDCPAPQGCFSGYCRACDVDQDCPADDICTRAGCEAALPGERCEAAIPILASETLQNVGGSGYRYSNTRVWYSLTIPFDALLTVATYDQGTYEGVEIYLRCEDSPTTSFALFNSNRAAITDQFIGAGTYALGYRIDGFPDESYPPNYFFSFGISIRPATQSPGSDCSNSIPLSLSGPGVQQVSVQGDTTGALPIKSARCGELGTVSYRSEVTENSIITATLTPLQSGADLGVWLKPYPCAYLSTSLSCEYYAVTDGGPAVATLKNFGASPFPIVVSSFAGASPYTLDVTKRPYPTNGTCPSAATLSFDAGTVVVSSDTTDVDPTRAGCDAQARKAVHYTFSTVGLGERSVSFDLLGLDAGSLTLRSACPTAPDISDILSCSSYNVDAPRLPEGHYFVQVAGDGAFTLRGTLGAPIAAPSNDDCSMALPVVSSTSSWGPVSGDTRGARGETVAICAPLPRDLPRDVFYRVTVPGPGRLSATVTPSTAEFDPILTLAASCTRDDVCVSDQPAGLGEVASTRVTSEAIVGVGGSTTSTEGPFSLSGTFQPAPAHDLCAGALPLTFGGSVSGSINAAFGDPNACTPTLPWMNLYYSFTAPSNGQGTVTLQPSGFDGAMHLLAGCGATTCSGFSPETGGIGVTESMTFPVARNLTYIVTVEARGTDPTGTFILSLAGP